MGTAGVYRCEECGYTCDWVTADFDCGMSGEVVTPVVCPEHGLRTASTGINRATGTGGPPRDSYPCPECGAVSPLWDRKTCPGCGHVGDGDDPPYELICWD